MTDYKLTDEATEVLKYIKTDLLKEYPAMKIRLEYFVLAAMECENCTAFRTLSRVMMSNALKKIKEMYHRMLFQNNEPFVLDGKEPKYVKEFDDCVKSIRKKDGEINSAEILLSIIRNDKSVRESFRLVGVTDVEIGNILKEIITKSDGGNEDAVRDKHRPKKINQPKTPPKEAKVVMMSQPMSEMGEAEQKLINLNQLAINGKIEEIVGNEEIYDTIYDILSKRERNNVVITGESGIGKTATVRNLANLLVTDSVPRPFRGKKLLQMDFAELIMGTFVKGSFESKFKNIVDDAARKGNYIIFIDDIHKILDERCKFAEVNTESLLDMIFSEKNIQFICTSSEKGYSAYIQSNPSIGRKFQKVAMTEKTEDECVGILRNAMLKYGTYHNVSYGDDVIKSAIRLCKRYVTDRKLPDSAIDLLDAVGARISNRMSENAEIDTLEEELREIERRQNEINASSDKFDYDRYDELTRQKIELNSRIAAVDKKMNMSSVPTEVTESDVRHAVSVRTGISVDEIGEDDRNKLKNISDRIKKYVIGQDNAVDEVCRAVKRQRVGLSNPNKPAVMLCVGSTGTGKTYLAKKLAGEIFGSEKKLVRIDMSEYSDKMSVNKLYGSASGYVGYEEGGLLTEAIKRNSHCVLLLDEIEKANDEVFNVLLQVFDDGRLTDNRGFVVDFRNVIIMMTSNLGAREISERGNSIGFVQKDERKADNDMIDKCIKSKFKPEFINRIDSIIHFNSLTDDDLRKIIMLEIEKIDERVRNMGYGLCEDILTGKFVNGILEKVRNEKEYGARPVMRWLQSELEDKLTDIIIDREIEKGYVFTMDDLNG